QGQAIGAGGLRLPDGTIIAPVARPENPKPQAIGAGGLRLPDGTIIPPAKKPGDPDNTFGSGTTGRVLDFMTRHAEAYGNRSLTPELERYFETAISHYQQPRIQQDPF